jgi:enoyl-CoA hydratase/carnithine racemase
MHRPPANFFDQELLSRLADVVLGLDTDQDVRCLVLASEGKHFCAGADLRGMDAAGIRAVYREALRLFQGRKPIVAAVQGAAIGGGLGLAMAADFRVASVDARLAANFARLGFHQGFGLSVTLPRAIGQQRALELLYTGRTVTGTEAASIGLCDRAVEGDPREAATELAHEIAASAPLSLMAIRGRLDARRGGTGAGLAAAHLRLRRGRGGIHRQAPSAVPWPVRSRAIDTRSDHYLEYIVRK